MPEEFQIDPEALDEEIARYLAAVDAFRAADCEPTWRAELLPRVPETLTTDAPRAEVERSAH